MPKTVNRPLPAEGESLFNSEEKLFPDIKAKPGQKAFVFIHTVPYEGSVLLVNLLTSTRLVRKGFDVNIVLYGPGVLAASGTRGYPAVWDPLPSPAIWRSTSNSRFCSRRVRPSTRAVSPWVRSTEWVRTT